MEIIEKIDDEKYEEFFWNIFNHDTNIFNDSGYRDSGELNREYAKIYKQNDDGSKEKIGSIEFSLEHLKDRFYIEIFDKYGICVNEDIINYYDSDGYRDENHNLLQWSVKEICDKHIEKIQEKGFKAFCNPEMEEKKNNTKRRR